MARVTHSWEPAVPGCFAKPHPGTLAPSMLRELQTETNDKQGCKVAPFQSSTSLSTGPSQHPLPPPRTGEGASLFLTLPSQDKHRLTYWMPEVSSPALGTCAPTPDQTGASPWARITLILLVLNALCKCQAAAVPRYSLLALCLQRCTWGPEFTMFRRFPLSGRRPRRLYPHQQSSPPPHPRLLPHQPRIHPRRFPSGAGRVHSTGSNPGWC